MKNDLARASLAFEADHLWVHQNKESLLAQYADQWIAVANGQVIASAPDLEGLLSRLEDPAHTCVEFITREPLEMVLCSGGTMASLVFRKWVGGGSSHERY